MSPEGKVLKLVTFGASELIYKPGAPASYAYIVREGEVQILRNSLADELDVAGIVGPGQIFGEAALLAPGPYPTGARALDGCSCVAIAKDTLDQRITESDPFIGALFKILAENLETILDRQMVNALAQEAASDYTMEPGNEIVDGFSDL